MGLLLSKDNSSPRDWLLAASSLQTAGRRTFLESVGGFDNTDAEDLLKLIWKDRNRFLEISSHVPTPGWALLLLILGEHMQWKSEVDDIWYEGWHPLETLCFRYSLVASASELKALETFCLECVQDRPDPGEGLDDIYYEGSLVNVHDARTFLQAHNKRMEHLSKDPFPDGLAVLLLRFLRQEPVLDAVDLIPPLLNASFSKIWSEIDTAKDASINLGENVNLIRYTTELFDLIERIYQVYAGTHEVLYPITQTLVNNDFVNLFGRITLLPLSVRSPIGTLANCDVESFIDMDDMQDPHGLARSWFDLIFGDLHTSELSSEMRGSVNGVFDSFYPDWTKMRRCFTANFPQHSVSSKAFKQQVKGSLVAWGTSLVPLAMRVVHPKWSFYACILVVPARRWKRVGNKWSVAGAWIHLTVALYVKARTGRELRNIVDHTTTQSNLVDLMKFMYHIKTSRL